MTQSPDDDPLIDVRTWSKARHGGVGSRHDWAMQAAQALLDGQDPPPYPHAEAEPHVEGAKLTTIKQLLRLA